MNDSILEALEPANPKLPSWFGENKFVTVIEPSGLRLDSSIYYLAKIVSHDSETNSIVVIGVETEESVTLENIQSISSNVLSAQHEQQKSRVMGIVQPEQYFTSQSSDKKSGVIQHKANQSLIDEYQGKECYTEEKVQDEHPKLPSWFVNKGYVTIMFEKVNEDGSTVKYYWLNQIDNIKDRYAIVDSSLKDWNDTINSNGVGNIKMCSPTHLIATAGVDNKLVNIYPPEVFGQIDKYHTEDMYRVFSTSKEISQGYKNSTAIPFKPEPMKLGVSIYLDRCTTLKDLVNIFNSSGVSDSMLYDLRSDDINRVFTRASELAEALTYRGAFDIRTDYVLINKEKQLTAVICPTHLLELVPEFRDYLLDNNIIVVQDIFVEE